MSDYLLILGNKNYSSWSCRAGLVMMRSGAPYEEIVFHLSAPGVRDEIRRHSPTGKVPALRHGDLVLWDSLAIAEYLAERHPDSALWPADPAQRARARSVAAEMHSGFPALRRSMPFNVRRSSPGKGRDDGVAADIARVTAIWRECLPRAQGGPFLFGPWCIADAFFTPLASRFSTYAVDLEADVQPYAKALLDWPDMQSWSEAARGETTVEPQFDL